MIASACTPWFRNIAKLWLPILSSQYYPCKPERERCKKECARTLDRLLRQHCPGLEESGVPHTCVHAFFLSGHEAANIHPRPVSSGGSRLYATALAMCSTCEPFRCTCTAYRTLSIYIWKRNIALQEFICLVRAGNLPAERYCHFVAGQKR